MMEHKTFPTASTKVIDEVRGIVEHVITVFGVLDLVKDISHPGSWTKTLTERGDKLLVLDMHNTDSINRAIGTPVSVREVGRNELPPGVLADYPEATGGVVAQTQLLMDTPEGKGAYIRLRDNAVREWSYGYDALDTDRSVVKDREGGDVNVRNLRTVKVYEYGPVLWGACPGTMVTGVKEGKPAPDVTENTIRIRVREPGDFQEDSFRTIAIGDEDDGIQAVVGRLDGETTTTVQSYVFDKEKWGTAEAQTWVDEHEKQAEPVEEEKTDSEEGVKGAVGPPELVIGGEETDAGQEGKSSIDGEEKAEETDDEEEAGSEKAVDPTNYIADVREAFENQHDPLDGPWDWVLGVYDKHVVVQRDVDGIRFYQVGYTKAEDSITFAPQGEWIGGAYVFVPEGKAGRVLAGRNEIRIISALLTLIDVLEDAGIELPGFEQSPVEEEATVTPVKQAVSEDNEAGPTEESPTLTELVRREEAKNLVDWLKEQVELLATLSKEVS